MKYIWEINNKHDKVETNMGKFLPKHNTYITEMWITIQAIISPRLYIIPLHLLQVRINPTFRIVSAIVSLLL